MAYSAADKNDGRTSDLNSDQIQFCLIFIATFAVLVSMAFIALLLPWRWSSRFGSDDKRWFIGRAWEEAGTFTELSFMG
jgi:hypothetical protein